MKIGNKEVIYSTGPIVSNDEEAQVDFVFAGERISLVMANRYSLYPRCSISTSPQRPLRYSATSRL